MTAQRRLLEAANRGATLARATRAASVLHALPGKKPLIELSYRPLNYETPIEYFQNPIMPNDVFFVRYHLSGIPKFGAER